MSGKNWSTTSSSAGGSTVLSPSHSSNGNYVNSNVITGVNNGNMPYSDFGTYGYSGIGSVIGDNPISYSNNFNNYLSDFQKNLVYRNDERANRAYSQQLSTYKQNMNDVFNMYKYLLAYQETLSNNAIQRRVIDLKKAGINPILAVRHLQPASVPNVSMPNFGSLPSFNYSNELMPSFQNESLDIYKLYIEYLINSEKILSNEKITTMNNSTQKIIQDMINHGKLDLENLQYLHSDLLADKNNQANFDREKMKKEYDQVISDLRNSSEQAIAKIYTDTTLKKTDKDNMASLIRSIVSNLVPNLSYSGSVNFNILG